MDLSEHYLDCAARGAVQELAVVGYKKNRAPECFQVVLEPLDGFYVQMVGRLVQKQAVRLGKKDFCQFDSHVPALAEFPCRTVEFFRPEAESDKDFLSLACRRLAFHHCHPVLYIVQFNDEIIVCIGLVICSFRELCGYLVNPVVECKQAVKGFHSLFHHGLVLCVGHHLWKVSDSLPFSLCYCPRCGRHFAEYQFKKGGLARPVLPHEADFLVVSDMYADVIQEREGPPGKREVVDGYHFASSSFSTFFSLHIIMLTS